MEDVVLNSPKKNYYAPSHTTEHILNRTMDNMFGCGRSFSAHIEEKKSKCDYRFPAGTKVPDQEQLALVEQKVNEIIQQNLPVTAKICTRQEAAELADLSKLPPDASEMLRLVCIGDYDVCPCIGQHVANTGEIGKFKILSSSYENEVLRLRWKILKD